MKNCIACKHFRFDSGWCGTEVTPGDPPDVNCVKRHWSLRLGGMYKDKANELLSQASKAETCSDYELSELAKSKGWQE